jgi:hypothetical protein
MSEQKRQAKYELFGELRSYNDLKSFETIKEFKNTNHDTRSLVKSTNGKLFLYDFHEEMGFPNDTIFEHFFLLENEQQAYEHANKHIIELKSIFADYIYIAPNYDIYVPKAV